MCEGICAAPRPSIVAAGTLLPHAADRLLRRHRQRAWAGMALCGQPVSARLPAPWRARASADHSWLSRTRSRLSLEVHDQVFSWVLERLAEHGLIKGERIGVDASTIEANAALRTIIRRDSGEGYREMLTRMAHESGIETPTAEDWSGWIANAKARSCPMRTGRARPIRMPGSPS